MGWSKYGQTDGPRPKVVKVELKSSARGDDQPEDQSESEQTEQSQGRREEATRAPGYVPQASLSQHAVRIRERFRSSERPFVLCRSALGRTFPLVVSIRLAHQVVSALDGGRRGLGGVEDRDRGLEKSRRRRSTTTWPRKPVTPVRKMCLDRPRRRPRGLGSVARP